MRAIEVIFALFIVAGLTAVGFSARAAKNPWRRRAKLVGPSLLLLATRNCGAIRSLASAVKRTPTAAVCGRRRSAHASTARCAAAMGGPMATTASGVQRKLALRTRGNAWEIKADDPTRWRYATAWKIKLNNGYQPLIRKNTDVGVSSFFRAHCCSNCRLLKNLETAADGRRVRDKGLQTTCW